MASTRLVLPTCVFNSVYGHISRFACWSNSAMFDQSQFDIAKWCTSTHISLSLTHYLAHADREFEQSLKCISRNVLFFIKIIQLFCYCDSILHFFFILEAKRILKKLKFTKINWIYELSVLFNAVSVFRLIKLRKTKKNNIWCQKFNCSMK